MTQISVSINGQQRSFLTEEPMAAEAIRTALGLTGTKIACGHGACGACVIEVDGTPVASCLLAVEELEGRVVRTVEGIAGDGLHPVQQAFMAHDGLQCGFCTPGFIVESVAFFDAWRRVHGKVRPGRDEVARAMAGHLCRCGAYEGIYAALQSACAGDFDDATEVAASRPDALEKVTGQARYTFDVVVPDMQHGCVVRATIPHGTVTAIDPAPALALTGVTGFVQLLPDDRRIRYLGQAVGAVAAVSEQVAHEAAARVEIAYEEEPAVFGIESALADDAPNLHQRGWTPPNSNEGRNLPNIRRGNRRGPTVLASIRPVKAVRRINRIKKVDPTLVVEDRWTVAVQMHTALEPHVTLARWRGDRSLEVHTSTQAVTVARRELAKHWDLDPADVGVAAEFVGGGFGAKNGYDTDVTAAVELARQVGAPVRVAYDRREELSYAGYRPGAEIELSVAADDGGSLAAVKMTSRAHGGVSAGQFISAFGRFNYRVPQFLADYDVLTNLPPGKPFRAPAGPLTLWALEQAIDQLAEQIGIDPITLRERSAPSPLRGRVYKAARTSTLWSERSIGIRSGRFLRGIGAAFGSWIYIFDPKTTVTVEADVNGLRVLAGAQDMGNGSRGILAAAVATALGVPASSVEVVIGDPDLGHGPASSGSRTTASLWPAGFEAATELRGRLVEELRTSPEMSDAVAVEGGVEHRGEFLDWADVLSRTGPLRVTARRPADQRVPIWRRGVNWALLRTSVSYGLPGSGFTEGGILLEVEVDTLLGRVRPLRAHGIIAAGTVHAPKLAESQVKGGIIQGLGYALYEERRIHPSNGLNLTANLEDYHLPGIGDTPEITVQFVEEGFDHVPGGGVGLAELSIVAVAAATGNAVANATGFRPRNLPIRPDSILEALK